MQLECSYKAQKMLKMGDSIEKVYGDQIKQKYHDPCTNSYFHLQCNGKNFHCFNFQVETISFKYFGMNSVLCDDVLSLKLVLRHPIRNFRIIVLCVLFSNYTFLSIRGCKTTSKSETIEVAYRPFVGNRYFK